jgi:glycerophosphoryl diester phosphodiesterase
MPPTELERQILPVVVAHRGASSRYPENTLESFEGAVQAGADVVELDVRLTSDDQAVIMHDLDVSSTTDGSGFIHEMTLAEVKRLDASGGRGPRAEVPTLREALALLSGRVGVDVEIKNMPGEPSFDSPREAGAQHVVQLLDEVGFRGPVLVSSFNWLSIERIRALAPDVSTGFLTTGVIDPFAALVYARANGHAYVLPQVPAVLSGGEEFVQESHLQGVLVGTWTVDEPALMERMFAMGVDAVATNDPQAAVPIRDRFRSAG